MMFNMNDVSDVLKEVVKPEHALAIDSVNSYEDMVSSELFVVASNLTVFKLGKVLYDEEHGVRSGEI